MTRVERLRVLNEKSYEAIAEAFDASRQHPWRELGRYANDIREGDRILDLGCGNGRLLKALPNVNYEYVGIDGNEFLISQAKAEAPRSIFCRERLEDVELVSGSFDHIFCIATFHHLVTREDRQLLLKKCHEALKPEGILILAVWNLWQWKYMRYLFSQVTYKISWNDFFVPWKLPAGTVWRYYHGFTARELVSLFREAGFTRSELDQEEAMSSQQWKKRNYIVRAVKE